MSDRGPYSRIYHSIIDDAKFATIYDDDRRLATWLRLLIVAEQAYPASGNIPTGTHRASLSALVDAGLLDLGAGSRFRVHGLDDERTWRSDAARVGGLASGRSRAVEHPLNGRSQTERTKSNLAEQSRAETSKAEQDVRDEPEGDVITWLARHGCALPPHSGYYRHVVLMVENHGTVAVLAMLEKLARAGTKHGDVKGFVFGTRDALDAKTRPDLRTLEKDDRQAERESASRNRVEATQKYLKDLRGETA